MANIEIKIGDKVVLTVTDQDQLDLNYDFRMTPGDNPLDSIEEQLDHIITHFIHRTIKSAQDHIIKDYIDLVEQDQASIPSNKAALTSLIRSRSDYKNKEQQDIDTANETRNGNGNGNGNGV